MHGLEVTVWRKFGHLRLYVAQGEAKVGWYDVRAGTYEIGTPDLADAFWTAVRQECEKLGEPLPDTTHSAEVPVAAPFDVPSPRAPEDLAVNRAGAAAQARAEELRNWRTRVAGLVGVRTEAGDFAFGAKGERAIGGRLDKWARAQGWHVLHAVPVGRNGADIDHVLIGPFGVVTVNTKRTRGKVWAAEQALLVNGVRTDYLRNSRHEVARARKLLDAAYGRHVPVRGPSFSSASKDSP
ncbi:nuclease-related domain-containing protein [Actinomadura yumaensis]|uniref:nuclease-related domain-containing protein n=1 Tax=Actinomadura yumaensis TaxID=111807 RepID=UPI003623837F